MVNQAASSKLSYENRSPTFSPKRSLESSPMTPDKSLTVRKIRRIFIDRFDQRLETYLCKCSNPEVKEALMGATLKYRNATPLSYYDSTRLSLGFYLQLQKEFDGVDEVGFLNFDVTVYSKPKTDQTIKLSYLSEIQLEPPFRGKGLFKLFYEPYIETLREIKVDIGYLHVKSKETITASLYAKCGYEFTPNTRQLIQEKYGNEATYLGDSSVSYDTTDTVEMVRLFSETDITELTSVSELKSQLSGSPKGIKRPRTPLTSSEEPGSDPFSSFGFGMSPSPKRSAITTPAQSPMVSNPFANMELISPVAPRTPKNTQRTSPVTSRTATTLVPTSPARTNHTSTSPASQRNTSVQLGSMSPVTLRNSLRFSSLLNGSTVPNIFGVTEDDSEPVGPAVFPKSLFSDQDQHL